MSSSQRNNNSSSRGSIYGIITIVLLGISLGGQRCLANGRVMDFLMEEEPAAISGGARVLLNGLLDMEESLSAAAAASPIASGTAPVSPAGGQCRIEFQVMKVIPGFCTRLGKGSARACVSGNHLIPFHPDCM